MEDKLKEKWKFWILRSPDRTIYTDPRIVIDEARKEIFDKFDEYACIKNDKWYLELKEKLIQ